MKKSWLAAIAAGTICLVAGGVLVYRSVSGDGAREALTAYMEYAEAGEYERMYEMLDADSQELVSQEAFMERNQNIYEGIGADHITLAFSEEEKEDPWISYTTVMDTDAGEITFDNQAFLHRERRKWKLQWSDNLIYPSLDQTDKVRVETLPAKRGSILTSDGKTLAGQGSVYEVGVVPGKLSGDPSDLERLAELLDISKESIETKLSASWVTEESFVPIKREKKTDETYQALLGEYFPTDWEAALLEIPGVLINDAEDRVYPLGEAAAHLVGYVQSVTAEDLEQLEGKGYTAASVLGKSGLEKAYETRLKGEDGCKISIVDQNGNEKEAVALKPKKDGEEIVTTIDSRLQQQLYEQYEEDNSCSVALNPRTGEVLALVSTPSFDSADFVFGMSQKVWDSLNQDTDHPMTNRFRSTLCPGSSFKPVTAAAGLTSGKLRAEENLGSSGVSWQKDGSWGDYYVTTLHTYGEDANLQNALIYSDNIYFAKAALQMGEETFIRQLTQMGFGQDLPFPLGLDTSTYSNTEGMETEIQLADSGYGQGQILINPLHLASIYTAFTNGGNMLLPHLEAKEGAGKVWIEEAMTEEAAATIQEALIQVIENSQGTGHGAYRYGLALAGKTGTAEIKLDQQDTTGTELGWFVCYTTQSPEADSLLLLTMVEDVKGRGGSGYVVDGTDAVLEAYLAER